MIDTIFTKNADTSHHLEDLSLGKVLGANNITCSISLSVTSCQNVNMNIILSSKIVIAKSVSTRLKNTKTLAWYKKILK